MVSVIDWLTFNVVFLAGSSIFDFPYLDRGDNGIYNVIMANVSYIIALQFVNISLHHRHLQPAKVLSNTSRTSTIFIVLYAALLGMSHVAVPGFLSSIVILLIVFLFTTIERLIVRSYLLHKKTSKSHNVNT
ncbi:MAG: hypothetical protein LUD48_06860, partial [Prevotella sp.]|nr:hypothetical protein [Prevotella sp.]